MIFICADSSTVEGSVHKGNTPSKGLFNQIVRTKRTKMTPDCIIYVIHCSGARMIKQGTDGTSRGCTNQRGISGEIFFGIHTFKPQCNRKYNHESKQWMDQQLPNDALFLTPEQWFVEGHDLRFDDSTTPRIFFVKKESMCGPPLQRQPMLFSCTKKLIRCCIFLMILLSILKRHMNL